MRRLSRSGFVRDATLLFSSNFVVSLFNYAFHLLISRMLGVVAYGTLYSLLAGLAFLCVPASVLTMIVVRYAAEFRVLGDGSHLHALSRWVLARTAAFAVIVVALGGALTGPIAAYLGIQDRRSVFLVSIVLALSVILPSVRGILQGVEDFKRLAESTIIEGALKAGLGVGLVFWGWGVNGAVLGNALGALVSLAYTWWAVRRHFAPQRDAFCPNGGRLMRAGAGMTGASLAIAGLSYLDVLLVKHYFPSHEAGLYSAVALVGKVLFFGVGFVPTIVLPKVTARVAGGLSPLPIIVQATIAVGGICGCGLAVLAVAPEFALRVMSGSAFLAAAPLVFPYACAMTLLGVTNVMVVYNVGLHRFGFVLPLCGVLAGEIATISILHGSLLQVIWILIVGHAAAAATTLYGISAPVRHSAEPAQGAA